MYSATGASSSLQAESVTGKPVIYNKGGVFIVPMCTQDVSIYGCLAYTLVFVANSINYTGGLTPALQAKCEYMVIGLNGLLWLHRHACWIHISRQIMALARTGHTGVGCIHGTYTQGQVESHMQGDCWVIV